MELTGKPGDKTKGLLTDFSSINNKQMDVISHQDHNISGSAKDSTNNEKVIKKLLVVCTICTLFMICEIIGGYIANSLAIMTDAAHLLSDLLGFAISIGALLIG